MKLKIITILFFTAIFLSISCARTFRVITPRAFQTASQEFSVADGHISVLITFNRSVEQSTVVVGETLIFKTDKDPSVNVKGTLTWSGADKVLLFRTDDPYEELLTFDPDGHFSLMLLGSDGGDGAIKDKDGNFLDGDQDNSDGGDYSTSFVLLG